MQEQNILPRLSTKINRPRPFYDQCRHNLSKTIRDKAKMEARSKDLQEHPEHRIRINTRNLRSIVKHMVFKCHPDCSIARDEAIAGSDIDGAIVFTRRATTLEQQVAFIQELRHQGFKAYHSSDIEMRKKQYAEAEARGIHDVQSGLELRQQITKAENAQIKFITLEQIREMMKGPLTQEVEIYVAGYTID